MIGGLTYSPLSMGILFTLITALSVHEFCSIVSERDDVEVNPMICSVSGAYLFLAFFGYCSGWTPTPAVFIPYLISVIYLLISELYLQRPCPIHNWAYTMMSQMYVALPFSMIACTGFHDRPCPSLRFALSLDIPPCRVYFPMDKRHRGLLLRFSVGQASAL